MLFWWGGVWTIPALLLILCSVITSEGPEEPCAMSWIQLDLAACKAEVPYSFYYFSLAHRKVTLKG